MRFEPQKLFHCFLFPVYDHSSKLMVQLVFVSLFFTIYCFVQMEIFKEKNENVCFNQKTVDKKKDGKYEGTAFK